MPRVGVLAAVGLGIVSGSVTAVAASLLVLLALHLTLAAVDGALGDALLRALVMATWPFGALLGGFAAARLGPRNWNATAILMAIVLVLGAVSLWGEQATRPSGALPLWGAMLAGLMVGAWMARRR
jgi:hypothetical protein